MPILEADADIRGLLERTRSIAVVGASADLARPSHRVFRFLLRHGYDALPVTPKPDAVCGVQPVPDLAAAARHWPEGIDMVDVFRRPEHVPGIVAEAKAVGARSIWFQLGVVHPEGIEAADAAGMDVVVDRCPAIEHPRLGLA